MKNKRKRQYSVITRVQAQNLAKRLGEKDNERFLEITANVPRPLILMALRETERADSFAIVPRLKVDSFMSRLKYYSKMFGIKLPKS